jgi:type IV pilus assembly protein PilV
MQLIPSRAHSDGTRFGTHSQQRGAGLIEILVSIVILSFGLLGLAGMFNYSTSANKSAASRLTASMLATDFAEVVRANRTAFGTGTYNSAIVAFDPTITTVAAVAGTSLCAFPNCNAQQSAQQDIALMQARTRAYLPAGNFAAQNVGTSNQIDIWIVWVEGNGQAPGATVAAPSNDNCPPSIINLNPAPNPYPRCLHHRVSL